MKINIITSELKKANRYLNISMLIFGLFMLLFFVSFWFQESDLMKSIYLISLFTSFGLILISILLLMFRQSRKRNIELDKNQIAELRINSQISTEKISEKSEIEYAGNEIEMNLDSKIYEIDNKTAFELLNNGTNLKSLNRTIKTNGFDISPKELFSGLMSMLWASS